MSRHIIYAISKIGIMAAIIMACLFTPSAYAQDTAKLSEEITIVEETPVLNSGNTAWLIVATIHEYSRYRIVLRRIGTPEKYIEYHHADITHCRRSQYIMGRFRI